MNSSDDSSDYFVLNPEDTDPKRLKKEREKARELKNTAWWKQKLADGICYYCHKKYSPKELTMDHLIPLARGGTSSKGNCVAACRQCNQQKKLQTPVDMILSRKGGNET